MTPTPRKIGKTRYLFEVIFEIWEKILFVRQRTENFVKSVVFNPFWPKSPLKTSKFNYLLHCLQNQQNAIWIPEIAPQ